MNSFLAGTFMGEFNGVTISIEVRVDGKNLAAHDDGPLGTGFSTGRIATLGDVAETFDTITTAVEEALHELEHLEESASENTDPMAEFFGFGPGTFGVIDQLQDADEFIDVGEDSVVRGYGAGI